MVPSHTIYVRCALYQMQRLVNSQRSQSQGCIDDELQDQVLSGLILLHELPFLPLCLPLMLYRILSSTIIVRIRYLSIQKYSLLYLSVYVVC